MNRLAKTAALIVVGGLLGWGAVMMFKPAKNETIKNMRFPKGLGQTVGRAGGVVCHEVWLWKDGQKALVSRHDIPGRDFSKATEEQKRAWIIEHTERDVEEAGIACAEPGGVFPVAYAQRQCWDCGGDCYVVSCPATYQPGGFCTLNGPTCVMSYLCCSGCTGACD